MSSNDDKQDKIISYIDFIKRHPRELKYFSFEDEGRKFIVDGNKIKMLPTEYAKFYQRDEFYLSVDPDNKKVIYYAFDVEDYISNTHKDESLGYFEWDKVVDQIYAFITLHLQELTSCTTPHCDISEKKTNTNSSTSSVRTNDPSYPRYRNSDYPYSGGNGFSGGSSTTSTSYYNKSYKEREAFCNKLSDLMKEQKTSVAIDHINSHIRKMCEEKKFDDLDALLRWITFDKLNVPTMITILDLTRGADHLLKERRDFFGKVKNHLMKIKPARAEYLLRNLEPGKEYKDVVKYKAK